MAIKRVASARLIRNPLMWLIAAVVVGTLLGWAAGSASADADGALEPHPGRVVVGAIAGADVLLPSSAIAAPVQLIPAEDS